MWPILKEKRQSIEKKKTLDDLEVAISRQGF